MHKKAPCRAQEGRTAKVAAAWARSVRARAAATLATASRNVSNICSRFASGAACARPYHSVTGRTQTSAHKSERLRHSSAQPLGASHNTSARVHVQSQPVFALECMPMIPIYCHLHMCPV